MSRIAKQRHRPEGEIAERRAAEAAMNGRKRIGVIALHDARARGATFEKRTAPLKARSARGSQADAEVGATRSARK